MGCSPSRTSSVSTEIVASKTLEYLLRSAEVKHSLGIVLEVKGFCDAVISLCGPQELVDYEATLGCQSNSACLLRSTRDPELTARREAIGILDQAAYRGFWLSWRPGQICLGKGYRPGQQEMASIPAEARADAAGYRPYCLKVSCPTAGSRVTFREPRLVFEEGY